MPDQTESLLSDTWAVSSGSKESDASAMRLAYRKDGFVLAPGLCSDDQVNELRANVDRIERLNPYPSEFDVYLESCSRTRSRVVRQIENFCSSEESMLQFANGVVKSHASMLLGAEGVLFKDKINFKHPGGGGYRAHRDGTFWWKCPLSGELRRGWEYYATEFVSAAVFLDTANLSNGCLEVVREGHLHRLDNAYHRDLTSDETAEMEFEPVLASAGDVLLMNALTPHRSGQNTSDISRRVVYLTYNRLSEGDHRTAYFHDKRLSLAAQGGAAANK